MYLIWAWDLHKLLNHTINISKFIRIRHFWIPNICHLVFRITLGLETNWYYILHYQRSWAIIVQVGLVGSCAAKKNVERNRVTNLGYLSYFKSSVSVSLRSGSKYSSPTSSTQNKAPAPGLKSTYIMSSLFKNSSISPSGAEMPPSLFVSEELYSVWAPAFIYVLLPVQGHLSVTHVLRNDSVGGCLLPFGCEEQI